MEEHRSTQVSLHVFPADAVDIVLDIGIAVRSNLHGIVLGRVGAVGILPFVRHTVAILVSRLRPRFQRPRRRDAERQLALVREERTFLAKALHLAHHVAVSQVTIREGSAHIRKKTVSKHLRRPDVQGRIAEARRVERRSTAVFAMRNLVWVELAVHVLVLPVVRGIHVEVGISACDGVGTASRHRTVDEQVAVDMHMARTLRIATHQVATVLPVIHDVVHVLVRALHLVVSGGVIHVEVPVKRDAVSLHQSASGVGEETLPDDAVLQGNQLRSRSLRVPVDGEGLVQAPREGAVVENHVLAIGDTSGILATRTTLAHAELHIAHDGVVSTRERHAVAIHDDALAWSRLTCHIEVLGKADAAGNLDDARHVEHHDAVGLTHSIAQRARSRVVQIGDVIHRTRASTRCKTSPSLSLRESQLLSVGADAHESDAASKKQFIDRIHIVN